MKRSLSPILMLVASAAHSHNGNEGWVDTQDYELWTNTYETEFIRVIPNDGVYNPASCTDPDSYFVSSSLSLEAQQRNYSVLLAAAMAKRPVRLRIDPGSCEGSKPKISNVVIKIEY